MNSKKYYEKYWNDESPPPANDPTTEERKHLLAQSLKKFSGSQESPKILDAGCGGGEFVGFFSDLGFEVHGIDISVRAIKMAKSRFPSVSLHPGSLEEPLLFSSGEFDVVWCTEVLEHVFDVPSALSEIGRVTKDGGLFILTVPYHGFLKNIAIAVHDFEKHFDVAGPHIRFFTLKSMGKCLHAAGFESIWWTGIGRTWPLYKSTYLVARKTPVVIMDVHDGNEE